MAIAVATLMDVGPVSIGESPPLASVPIDDCDDQPAGWVESIMDPTMQAAPNGAFDETDDSGPVWRR